MGRLAGKTAIITGGASGIGRAACHMFAKEGAEVAIFDISENGAAVADEIQSAGGQAAFHQVDLTIESQVEAAVKAVVERFGKLNILYNNTGGSTAKDGPLTTCPDEEFWGTIKRDLYTTWLSSRHAIPAIAKSGGGSVINTTSGRAFRGMAGKHAYTAAKGAIVSLTRSMAVDGAPDKIRVNAVCPGLVATDRALDMMVKIPALRENVDKTHLLGLVDPADIVMMVIYLASDESRVTTGQIFPVDSGYLAQ